MSKKRSLYELPGAAGQGGYVYAVLYSTGVVRVGRTVNARAELTAIRKDARASGIDLADWWASVPHEEWIRNEGWLNETCRAVATGRTGPQCYSGVDFTLLTGKAHDLPCTSTEKYAGSRRYRTREGQYERDQRMAVAVRRKAEGMTLRKIAETQGVSHTTIRTDIERWERVKDQMPLEIIRLARPAGNQGWKPGPSDTPPDGGSPVPGFQEEVSSAPADLIPFRRSA